MEPNFVTPIAELMAATFIMLALIAFARVFWKSSKGGAAEQLVRSVSDRCVEDISRRLQADLSTMSAAEMRGYVRARAVSVVRKQSRLAAAEAGQECLPEEVFTRALERAVHLVMRQSMTTHAMPGAVRAG
jgi:hypothetical protein